MPKAILAIVFIALLLAARTSYADAISVGDIIHLTGSSGTLGGGAFWIDNTATGPGVDFLTFCVQMSQHVDYTSPFLVGSITGYADDAAGPDYLSTETEWIFSNFRSGALSTYSSDEIQASIWILEDEWTTNIGQSAALISLARDHVAAGWANDGVGVLNLFYTDGRQAQDQLTQSAPTQGLPTPTPEPATLGLMGIGALVLARKRRRAMRA
jgi:PEP-CTERM motif-containing protein